jgi:ketosteroid isomerase-like protein
MNKTRRTMLTTGACALGATAASSRGAAARSERGLRPEDVETLRKYYAAWEKRDWLAIDVLLTDDFTFTSANKDDHIDKGTFKRRCWETQIDFIDHFELQHVIGDRDEAFVMYVCRTKNGNAFRNVEFLRLRDAKVAAIECYFGEQASFPSAASRRHA